MEGEEKTTSFTDDVCTLCTVHRRSERDPAIPELYAASNPQGVLSEAG
jgi:hypothetical protein